MVKEFKDGQETRDGYVNFTELHTPFEESDTPFESEPDTDVTEFYREVEGSDYCETSYLANFSSDIGRVEDTGKPDAKLAPEYSNLETRLRNIQEISSELAVHGEQLSGEADKFTNLVLENYHTNPEGHGGIENALAREIPNTTQDLMDTARELSDKLNELDSVQSELQEYISQKTADLRADLDRALEHLDSGAIAERVVSSIVDGNGKKNNWSEISQVLDHVKTLDGPQVERYEDLLVIEEDLKYKFEVWEQSGLFSECPSMENQELSDYEQEILNRVNNVPLAEELIIKYRMKHEVTDSVPHKLHDISSKIDETLSGSTIGNKIATAFKKRVSQEGDHLPAVDYELSKDDLEYQRLAAEARALDPEELLSQVEIDFDVAPLISKCVTTDEIKNFIRDFIPPIALRDLKSIKWVSSLPDNFSKDTSGVALKPENDSCHIFLSLSSFTELAMKYRGQLTAEESYENTKAAIYHTVAHELTHNLQDLVPVAALQEWDKSIKNSGPGPTPYVEALSREEDPLKFCEDLPESLGLFLVAPSLLINGSSDRVDGVLDVFRDFCTETQKAQIMRLVRKNVQDDLSSGV